MCLNVNYLVDYENTGNSFLSFSDYFYDEDTVTLLLPKGRGLQAFTIESIKELIKCRSVIQIEEVFTGKRNALDFQLCCKLGELTVCHPESVHCIISNDNGYLPLIKYYNQKGIQVVQLKTNGTIVHLGESDISRFSKLENANEECEVEEVKEVEETRTISEVVLDTSVEIKSIEVCMIEPSIEEGLEVTNTLCENIMPPTFEDILASKSDMYCHNLLGQIMDNVTEIVGIGKVRVVRNTLMESSRALTRQGLLYQLYLMTKDKSRNEVIEGLNKSRFIGNRFIMNKTVNSNWSILDNTNLKMHMSKIFKELEDEYDEQVYSI